MRQREVMEENSEDHMAMEKSAANDVVEVQEPASRRNVETVVVVEKIKDEEVSPMKTANLLKKSETKPDLEPVKNPESVPPIKKIIIKAANKDYQIVKILPKSSNMTDDSQKSTSNETQGNNPAQALASQSSVSAAKALIQKPITKDIEKTAHENPVKVLGLQSIQMPPIKNPLSQESVKEPTTKTSTDKEQSKESPNKINLDKDQPIKPNLSKEQLNKLSPTKEQSSKQILLKDQPTKPSPVKEQPAKPSPIKEQPAKPSPIKEQTAKPSPIKEQTAKPSSIKEQPYKPTLIRQQSSKSSAIKEQSSKLSANEDQQIKTNITKGQSSPAKEPSSQESLLKEQPSKPSPAKEQPSKQSLVMEQPTKGNATPNKETRLSIKAIQSKEQTAKTTPIKEVSSKATSKDLSLSDNTNIVSTGSSKPEVIISKGSSTVSPMEIDKEASNDSQIETNSDTSEREHKNISRELKSLIKSAKESKIINECTQLTSKTRKSRALDSSNTSLNASVEADKIQGIRRGSDNSQISGSSELSEKGLKRSMRSQNPEFVNKVKQFLNSVTGKAHKEGEGSDEENDEVKSQENVNEPRSSTPKRKKIEQSLPEKDNKLRTDSYCWRCHWVIDTSPNSCTVCPRAFHYKCLTTSERGKVPKESDKNWVCPECLTILNAESSESRSPAMKKISLGMLCELLKYALERMMDINGVEPFMHPVDRTVFPDYDKYVVHSMDLSLMKQSIAEGLYGSTEAFLADAQWILHNSIIFNTLQSKLTATARALVRSCRAEMGEVEACPECYSAAHARKPTWFTDVCSTPHILLWAKLKGFPYWPAKGMSVNSSGMVDVRFFGAHDRAWVPAKDCFLFSEKDPNNFRTKRQDILESMQEAEHHIRTISRKYAKFVYPPFKTQFDPTKLYEQLKMMIPSFEGEVRTPVKAKPPNSSPSLKEKQQSASKSSKGSTNDGDTSEGEDTSASVPRKMADGAEIAMEEDYSIEKEKNKPVEKPMEVDIPKVKEGKQDAPRKRRRSELEEATFTIIECSKEKKTRVESVDKPQEEKSLKESDTKGAKVNDSKETTEPKEQVKAMGVESSKPKEIVPSASSANGTAEKKLTPKSGSSRLISITKVLKTSKVTPVKVTSPTAEKPQQKQKPKLVRSNSSDKTQEERKEFKPQRRRSSKSNKSLNDGNAGKTDRGLDKKNEISADSVNKEKMKDSAANKHSESVKNTSEKSTPSSSNTASPSSKERITFDDDTSLAVLARETTKTVITTDMNRLPTITSVRSLSIPETTITKTSASKSIEITVDATPNSNIFTPTSTDNVRNMKEAVNKLQILRNETQASPPVVGRVGVCAFARMTSPPKETRPDDIEVEIKSEPIDLDDADRQMEKLDLMNAFKLRPVNGPSNLRDVRMNRVVVSSGPRKKAPPKPVEIRPRAKKTFPQPKKADDGRSELNSKNSMVYIPIQPPMTQAPPLRPQKPHNANGPSSTPPGPRPIVPVLSGAPNNVLNTITPPLVPVSLPPLSSSTPTSLPSTSCGSSPLQGVPTVGQVPTTVHTVPLITSVNGQWTFSLQPIMSVGGVDRMSSPPLLNGMPTRTKPPAPLALPAAAPAPALVPALPHAVQPIAPAPPALIPPAAVQTNSKSSDSTTSTPGEPPRLQQRPSLVNPLDPSASVGSMPPPSTAGPLTAKLNQNAVKMTDFFRTLLEDSLEKLDEPVTQLTTAKLQLEQVAWRHQQQIEEIKHNHELVLAEMRSSFEKEKIRLVSETRRATQVELEAAVKLAKSKQWCANCSQEAQFYCCWNTSYCDYPCQRAHWAQHYATCTQQRSQDNPNTPDKRLPLPENLPKTTAAPNLTVGGKLAPRVFTQDPNSSSKSQIIMSMVEDTSGNQSLKCVGTYKPPTAAQMSPLIINKQIMTNEEAAKKVVTSGGYLIVGAANTSTGAPNTPAIVTPPSRRTHTIQYYT